MIPLIISFVGVCVTTLCMYALYKACSAWYRRRFGEALLKDIKAAKHAESKDSIG